MDERDHRSGEPARDAAIEQAEILRAVERSAAEAAAGRGRALTRSSATSYGALRRCASGVSGGILPSGGSTTSHARLPFVTSRLSRNWQRADTAARRSIDLQLPLLEDIGQLRARHVLDPPSLEFRRPLERRALLVLVREIALQVGIAPRCPGHGPGLVACRLGAAGFGGETRRFAV